MVYFPADNIASAPTIATATNIIAARPAKKTKACGPNTADPKARAPTPNAASDSATPSPHFIEGYLLYFPILRISEVRAITPAKINIVTPPFNASVGLINLSMIFIANAIAMATIATATPKNIILNIVEKVNLSNDLENFAKIKLDTATAKEIRVKSNGSKITFLKLISPIILRAKAATIEIMPIAIPTSAIFTIVKKFIFSRLLIILSWPKI